MPTSSPLYVTAVPGSIRRIMLTQSSRSSPSRDATLPWSWFPSCGQDSQFGIHPPENSPHLHYNNRLMPVETIAVHLKPNETHEDTSPAKCRVIELQSRLAAILCIMRMTCPTFPSDFVCCLRRTVEEICLIILSLKLISHSLLRKRGHAVSKLVGAICNKPEGRGFHSR
jgi:hypothetical protein